MRTSMGDRRLSVRAPVQVLAPVQVQVLAPAPARVQELVLVLAPAPAQAQVPVQVQVLAQAQVLAQVLVPVPVQVQIPVPVQVQALALARWRPSCPQWRRRRHRRPLRRRLSAGAARVRIPRAPPTGVERRRLRSPEGMRDGPWEMRQEIGREGEAVGLVG